MKTLFELYRETLRKPVNPKPVKLNGLNGHKLTKKPIDWFKVAILALASAYVVPVSIREWQIVTLNMHKQGEYWPWEPQTAVCTP